MTFAAIVGLIGLFLLSGCHSTPLGGNSPSAADENSPTITPERVGIWNHRAALLKSIDYYQVERRTLVLDGRPYSLQVAHGTAGIRSLMMRTLSIAENPDFTHPTLLISEQELRSLRGSRSTSADVAALLNNQQLLVCSSSDLDSLGLPGHSQAWLFDREPMRPGSSGYVLGQIANDTAPNWYFGFGHHSVQETQEFEASLLSFPLRERRVNPWNVTGLALCFGLLALPATIPLGFGASPPPAVRE